MKKAEIRAQIEALELERRSFMEEVRHGTGEFKEDEAKAKLEDFDKRRADLERAYAELEKPEAGDSALHLTNRDFIDAAREMRSITIGANGKINQVQQLFALLPLRCIACGVYARSAAESVHAQAAVVGDSRQPDYVIHCLCLYQRIFREGRAVLVGVAVGACLAL